MSEAIVITKQTGAPADGQNIVLSDGKAVSLDVLAAAVRDVLGGASPRNLLKGAYSLSYDDSAYTAGTRTYPLTVALTTPLTVKAGDMLAVAIESVDVEKGDYSHIRVALTNLLIMTRTTNTNSQGGGALVIKASKDVTLDHILLYPCDASGHTGGIKCKVNGVTFVRGSVPMTGWLPAPSLSGGGNLQYIRQLYFNVRNRSERSAA